RWFAAKARSIRGCQVLEAFRVPAGPAAPPMRLLVVHVDYTEGDPERYLVPVVLAEAERAANILGDHPGAGILEVEDGSGGRATLCDATWEREFWPPLLEMIARRRTLRGERG